MSVTTVAPVAGPSVTSPTLLTPRQGAMSLQPQLAALAEAVPAGSRPLSALGMSSRTQTASGPTNDERQEARSPSPALTVSNGPNSPVSYPDSLAVSSAPSPNPTSVSSSSHAANVSHPHAEVGLGTLQGEDELKTALLGKDRLWLILLAKEVEAFLERLQRGEAIPEHDVPLPTAALVDTFGPSKVVEATPMSKYQRMLVYKTAEWYGLRAVAGPEAIMLLGVLGSLDPRSLKLGDLVKREATPQTQFRIMRREEGSGSHNSRATSVSGDDAESSSSRMQKTLEERELAYALARKRIIGDDDGGSERAAAVAQSRPPPSEVYDELNPRHPYSNDFDVVYPSLYNMPKDGQTTPGPVANQAASFAYQQGIQYAYPTYPVQQPLYPMPSQGFYADPYAQGGYPPMTMAYPPQPWQGQPMQQQPVMMGGWTYSNGVAGPVDHTMPGQGMPMIQQGVPFNYGSPFPQQYPQAPMPPAQQPQLAQPTPMRPGMHPHSSASSSMSSRSYQDGQSRPHSRGSTTSTRSAASSVRIGAMYPSTGQHGYRQKGMKGQSGGFAGLTTMGAERRARGQSPASTTSSRSSLQAASIQIQPPQEGQHPLPQRPDWAANNVPYRPSPMPTRSEPSQTDFPPLARNGTNAEPMQAEKARVRAASGGVWNGTGARAIQHPPAHGHMPPRLDGHNAPPPPPPHQYQIQQHAPTPPHQPPAPFQPPPQHQPPAVQPPAHAARHADADPDFPRRVPSSRTPALFDPTASRSAPTTRPPAAAVPAAGTQTARLHTPAAASAPAAPLPPPSSVVDDIEARLAAVSVSAGVSIGPPAARPPPSYAKIVRRD